MIEAIIGWIGIGVFELVQTLRKKPTLSKAAWAFGRKRWIFGVLLIVGVVALSIHLLQPLWTPHDPPVVTDCRDTEGYC